MSDIRQPSWIVAGGVLQYNGQPRAKLVELTRDASGPEAALDSRTRQWRRVAPNLCVHGLWGDCVPRVTDGVHAVVDVGDGHCVEVAVTSLLGPIGPQRVAPEDWNWDTNSRRVRVFKRKAPLPPAVIPVNTEMDTYWATHPKLRQNEHDVLVAIGWGYLAPERYDATLAALDAAVLASKNEPKTGSPTMKPLSAKVKAALNED